ncbi:MAG: ABC transporter substrate-binding protein [Planctomycetota bacterium]
MQQAIPSQNPRSETPCLPSRRMCLKATTGALAGLPGLFTGCADSREGLTPANSPVLSQPWSDIVTAATGTRVRMAMWDGDPSINRWMQGWVAAELQRLHHVQLEFSGLRGSDLVARLLTERQAGRTRGDIDVVWINGETFYQLRRISALQGPFTQQLPNQQWIDWNDPFIATDFQQPVEGYECPWGTVQFAWIHHSHRVPQPPQTLRQLSDWIEKHPGRFTWDVSFTGMTFLKSLLLELSGDRQAFTQPLTESLWTAASEKLWSWIRGVQPSLWREGRTFPEDVAQLHGLFSSDEVDFTMSANDGEVDNKVMQGVLPEAARAWVPEFGSIRNSHYLGIPCSAPNTPGALVLIDFLISPAAQLEKAKPEIWGDGSVLATHRLPEDWRQKFAGIPGRIRAPDPDHLRKRALPEPSAEVMMRLVQGFRNEILDRA